LGNLKSADMQFLGKKGEKKQTKTNRNKKKENNTERNL